MFFWRARFWPALFCTALSCLALISLVLFCPARFCASALLPCAFLTVSRAYTVEPSKYKPQENFKAIYISALKTLENPWNNPNNKIKQLTSKTNSSNLFNHCRTEGTKSKAFYELNINIAWSKILCYHVRENCFVRSKIFLSKPKKL